MSIDHPRAQDTAGERDRIGFEQVAMLHGLARVGVTGAFFGLLVMAALFVRLGSTTPQAALIWILVDCAVAGTHLWLGFRWLANPPPPARWRIAAYRFTACSLAEGLMWGLGAVLVVSAGDNAAQLLFVAVTLSLGAGSVVAFGSYLPACLAFMLPATLPPLIRLIAEGGLFRDGAALMTAIFVLCMLGLAQRTNAAFLEGVRLRFANLDLAERLREERDRAEQANAAKSRFLAAASHDLRQPVHALGVLLEAVADAELSAANNRVLELMRQSVSALGGLFDALLDISRLDAGIVAVERRAIPLGPFLARLCAEYRRQAELKGVRLVLHPCRLSLDSDPVLLERIVRNLLDNAVRYTDRGRIVVGCRRAGPGACLEVWDTGRGIPAAEQAGVFEEFRQLDNPERDRTKGLGLGLAIVRRLAALLDHRVTLCSEPGRGSVFRVIVPLAEAGSAVECLPAQAVRHPARSLVLVIDDEATIREALHLLLVRWGHDVLTAGSGAQMLGLLAREDARPGLILCDFRLPGHESGIDAIASLRAACGAPVPAILMTGDTGPERLAEAQASGLLLLHKPVAPGRLRAAVGALMAETGEPA